MPTFPTACPNNSLGFRIAAFIGLAPGALLSADSDSHQGPRRKFSGNQIIVGLVAHVLQFQGCFAFHMKQFFGMDASPSALSQRRSAMGSEPFRAILRVALRPLAGAAEHSGCFFKGLRLTGIDGTQWSLSNTPQINAATTKTRTRRGLAAFAKLSMVALVELGTHAPLAAVFAAGALRELAWSVVLLAQLPQCSLLLLDRLYGQAPMLDDLQKGCAATGSHFLVRVRQKLTVALLQALGDGSAMVSVRLRRKGQRKGKGKGEFLTVREVQGRVWNRRTKKWVTVRLWTSLGEKEATALELLKLYARRWEQEIFFKQLKLELAGGALLQSHTVATAEQEIAALLVAASLLAQERLEIARCAGGEIADAGAVRISFGLCYHYITALYMVLAASDGLLSTGAQDELIERVRTVIAAEALPKRRPRSCARKVRQPVSKWPRMLEPESLSSPILCEVSIIA